MKPLQAEKFRNFIARLRRALVADYVAVNAQRNPIAAQLAHLQLERIGYVIEQYSFFPREIVTLLYSARTAARTAGWSLVDAELTRNLGEELGTETKGVPHAEMLLQGIEHALGMVHVRKAEAGPATEQFLKSMTHLFGNADQVAYIAGAAYALESSAVRELKIVWRLIERYRRLQHDGNDHSELTRFFDAHLKVWEPGHEAGLRAACQSYIAESPEERRNFEAGFRGVLALMDAWWHGLAAEIRTR